MSVDTTLPAHLQEELVNELLDNEFILHQDIVTHRGSARAQRLRCFLYTNGYINKEKFREIMHKKLLQYGELMYKIHLDSRKNRLPMYPDHLPSPHALGYVIKHGLVSATSIKFDHGELDEEYIAMADGLLDKVIDQLIITHERPLKALE